MEIKKFNKKKKTTPDIHHDDQIKNNQIGRACSTHGKEKNTGVLWQNLKGKQRIIHTKKQSIVCEMNFKIVSETYGRLETHLLG